MNLYKLHSDKTQLFGHDIYGAKRILAGIHERTTTMQETGEILDTDMNYYMNSMGVRNKDVEEFLLTHAFTSTLILNYCMKVIKGRWKAGEDKMIEERDGTALRHYAMFVIRDRFYEAEDVIMKQGEEALNYSTDVIGHRWLEAEKYIKQDANAWADYKNDWDME